MINRFDNPNVCWSGEQEKTRCWQIQEQRRMTINLMCEVDE